MFYFVSEGFYDADLRSSENNITGRIIELYMTLINHYLELGLPFVKSFYSNNNSALSAYMTETDGKFMTNSIMAKSEDEMEKAYKLGLILEGTDLHMVCKDLCTIIKVSVFEWCLCNGSTDIETVVSRIITRYLDGYQRRSILTDPFKMQLAGKKSPVSFVAYDIIYHKDSLVTDLPLIERKKLLEQNVKEIDRFAISRYIENNGIALYNVAEQQKLEGVVAKEKSSKYWFDKKSKDWIKIKYLKDMDFAICGYILKDNGCLV